MSWALAIHGGAGLIRRNSLSAEREAACRAALSAVIEQGARSLAAGRPAMDAVVEAVAALEEDRLFNAGRGAVLTSNGLAELDAAVMDGAERRAGAVTAVKTTRNPIHLARAVMDQTPHVLLAGAGADDFAVALGLEQVDRDWFVTEERLAQLRDLQRTGGVGLDHGEASHDRYGTVGAVACDAHGNLAVATSTGGMANQRPGRVGDTPVLGAGTFASNTSCAVSGTGQGEPFIRLGVASRVAAWMEIGGLSLAQAADRVIHQELEPFQGLGGLIAVDATGQIAMPFNTGGMFRAAADHHGLHTVEIW